MRIALVSLFVVLAGCKDAAKPAPKAVSVQATTQADIEPIEGALAYPFTHAESRLSWVGSKVTGKHVEYCRRDLVLPDTARCDPMPEVRGSA